jgi:lipid-binding SYLF domain-containing protein
VQSVVRFRSCVSDIPAASNAKPIRRVDIRVPENGLNCPEIRATVQHVCPQAVAEHPSGPQFFPGIVCALCEVQVIALRLTKCIVNRLMRLNMKTKIVTFLVAVAVMSSIASAESYEERLADSTTVLREMSHASDKRIPQDLLQKARCVVVVPGLKKVAFIGGGKYGHGYASCMTRKGWSPPAAVRIEGGSFGLQLGGSSTDVIMLVLNEGGMKKLLSDKFTLGGEAAAAAGPVGRNTSANTDVLMNAEILS